MLVFATALSVCHISASVDASTEQETEAELKHHASIVGGVTLIPKGSEDPGDDYVIAPTLGVEYEYEINPHWSAAAMADVEFKEYFVEIGGGRLKRENIFILALVAMYEVVPRFLVYLGPGYEIEKNESLFVIRAGVKYEFEFSEGLDITPTIEADFKETEYASVFFGASVGKRF
jgi:hypothetical protein